jgi:hypothetical protein
MGFLRKTLYTIVGLPTLALGAEYFYTIKCVEVGHTDRLIKRCPLVARRVAENKARFDRFERAVPIASLKVAGADLDEQSLSRRLAKQIWLSEAYTPQRVISEKIFKDHKEPDANLTTEELKNGKIKLGYDVSQHLYVSDISGSYIQFEPRVPADVDFPGPGGTVCVDVTRQGENVVFALECASIGISTTGPLSPGDRLQFELHKIYARLLLESGVRRVLHGGGE